MTKFLLPALLAAALALAGCAPGQGINRQAGGTLIGAGLGGLAGSAIGEGSGRTAAIIGGALLGGFIGNQVGAQLDEYDRQLAQQAAYRATYAPIGESIEWNNPNTGNYGYYRPTREGTTRSGRICREFEQVIYVGGREETAVGTACQRGDGTWEVQGGGSF